MKLSKTLSVLVLVLLSLLLTTFTFAYWAGSVDKPTEVVDHTVNIGKGDAVSTKIEVSPHENSKATLVPAGREKSGEVSSIDYTFKVYWKSNEGSPDGPAKGAIGTLKVGHSDLMSQKVRAGVGSEPAKGIFIHKITSGNDTQIVADGEPVEVKVTLTMTEPKTEADYDTVADKILKSTYEFSIE